MLAAGVVEVLAGGKDLDRLSAGAGSQLEQARVQALLEEQVRGQDSEHGQGLSRIGSIWKASRTLLRLSHFRNSSDRTVLAGGDAGSGGQ
jgi:hypothetical protein